MKWDGQVLNKARAVLGPLLLAGAAAMAVSGLNSARPTRMFSSGEFENRSGWFIRLHWGTRSAVNTASTKPLGIFAFAGIWTREPSAERRRTLVGTGTCWSNE